MNCSSLEAQAGPPTTASQAYNAIVFSLFVGGIAAQLAAFRRYKKRYERTRVRRVTVLAVYAVAFATYSCGAFLPHVVGLDAFPCWLTQLLVMEAAPLIGTAAVLRQTVFVMRSRLARVVALFAPDTMVSEDRITPTFALEALGSVVRALFDARFDTTVETAPVVARALRFVLSRVGLVSFAGLFLVPLTLVNVLVVATDPGSACYGCAPYQTFRGSTPVVGIVVACLGAPFFVLSASITARYASASDVYPDRWGFFAGEGKGMIVFMGAALICLLLAAFGVGADQLVKPDIGTMVGSLLGFGCFAVLPFAIAVRRGEPSLGAVAKELEPSGPSSSTSPAPHGHRDAAVASSPRATLSGAPSGAAASATVNGVRNVPHLAQLLTVPTTKRKLEAHLTSEWTSESLMFLEATGEWRATFFEAVPTARLARARKLVALYCRADSALEINVPHATRQGILVDLARAERDPTATRREMFDEARQDVALVLELGSVRRFLGHVDL